MRLPRLTTPRTCVTLLLLLSACPRLQAQIVTPRTVPVFQDEQFAITPASRPALAGLTIAFDDTLADPFANPAKLSRLHVPMITTSPYKHSIATGGGGGQTWPVSVTGVSGAWSAAFTIAAQQLDLGNQWNTTVSESSADNLYYTAMLSRAVGDGIAVGASVSRAKLEAIDGVRLLYAGSDRLLQGGGNIDYRLGATKEFSPGHVLELVALRDESHMRHDAHFTTTTFDNTKRTWTTSQRWDTNLDETTIWGLHSEYARPVGNDGWTVGALGTANWLSHPHIPNYVLVNLPRDPGTTNAYNAGVGAVRIKGPFTFGLNYVVEPMTSDTYADAATAVTRADGSTIPAGEKTVENHFVFRNRKAMLGLGYTWFHDPVAHTGITADFALSKYDIDYTLTQTSNIARTTRDQREHWSEGGPSFGLRYHVADIEVSYAFRVNCGSGSCDVFPSNGDNLVYATPASSTGTIIAAPSSPLTLRSGAETSHHLTFSFPLR